MEPAPVEPTRDDAGAALSSCPMPMPTSPGQTPVTVRSLSVSPQVFCEELPSLRASPCPSSIGEDFDEEEEGQFDDAEEDDIGEPWQLPPCEQPLPPSPTPSPVPSPQPLPPCEQPLLPSPSSSPTPSPVPSQVDRLVRQILEVKRLAAETGLLAASPDIATVAADKPRDKGLNDVMPMDTSVQGESPSALSGSPCSAPPEELLPPTPLPPSNAGRGVLVKQLFAPPGAFAAPRMVRPPSVVRKPAKELTALEPSTLPPLLPRMHIRPMTIDYGHLSASSLAPPPADTHIQAALSQVTSPQSGLFNPANQPELALPKPYSMPLPRTSPITPVLDEAPVGSPPSPMDSENDLPLNSIPVAEIRNAYASISSGGAPRMPVIVSGPGPQRPGTAVKLLVSAPKSPRHHYGQSRNQ